MSENLFDGEPTATAAPPVETAAAPTETAVAAAAPTAPTRRGRPPGTKNKATEVEADAGEPVAPLVASAKIVYGKGKVALPGDFFVPASEDERDYLLGLDGVVAELTEAELALYEKLNG